MFNTWCKIVLFQLLYMISTKFLSDATNLEIINGKLIKITEVPYMAGFGYNNKMVCGAAIIHKRFVLTARHFSFSKGKKFQVYVGSDIRKDITNNFYDVEQVFHDDSNFTEVVVLKLKTELEFNDRVKPIKLADPDIEIKDGEMFDVIGFGITENGSEADKFYQVNVPYVNPKKCSDAWKPTHIRSNMICAGGENNKGTCMGDSGGPLRYKNQLVGLVWFGKPCAIGVPDVYARVSTARQFIDDVMNNNSVESNNN